LAQVARQRAGSRPRARRRATPASEARMQWLLVAALAAALGRTRGLRAGRAVEADRSRQAPAGSALGGGDPAATEGQATASADNAPDVPVNMELASGDKGFVALAMANWTAAAEKVTAALSVVAAVPAVRFELASEMDEKINIQPDLSLVQTEYIPPLYFADLTITAGRPAGCPCPCIPGTPAADVAQAIQAAMTAGPVAGFAWTFRAAGGPWASTALFEKPPMPTAEEKAVPFFDPVKDKVVAPAQALAFSKGTQALVDAFEADEQAAAGRAAVATSTSGKQIPCTVTSPDGSPAPCLFPGKVAAEIPQDDAR